MTETTETKTTLRSQVSELDADVQEYIKESIRTVFDNFLPESPIRGQCRAAATAFKAGKLDELVKELSAMLEYLHKQNSPINEVVQGALEAAQDNKVPQVVIPEPEKPLEL